MARVSAVVVVLCVVRAALAADVRVVLRSDESGAEDEWRAVTLLPFVTRRAAPAAAPPPHEPPRTVRPAHPTELVFPLVYRQRHINSMFKFGADWYTWSSDRRADDTHALNYYLCRDEPKRCDEVGWERAESVPRCAFQIESVSADDRACVSTFGVEAAAARCDPAHLMKVSDIVHRCGARVRSLWRFVRAGRREGGAGKPADVNSLLCDDEDECYVTIEYRIHHDRITFSVHEPSRGQTFKSVLKRPSGDEEPSTEPPRHLPGQLSVRVRSEPRWPPGKGALKEHDAAHAARAGSLNHIDRRDDLSDDVSD